MPARTPRNLNGHRWPDDPKAACAELRAWFVDWEIDYEPRPGDNAFAFGSYRAVKEHGNNRRSGVEARDPATLARGIATSNEAGPWL